MHDLILSTPPGLQYPFFKLSQIVGYSHMVTELIQFVLM